MQSSSRLSSVLRAAAVVLLVAGIGIWAGTGGRVGWTQTSTVVLQHDEITGIDYPVRQPAFVAGVEIPVAAVVAAIVLAGTSFLTGRRGSQPA